MCWVLGRSFALQEGLCRGFAPSWQQNPKFMQTRELVSCSRIQGRQPSRDELARRSCAERPMLRTPLRNSPPAHVAAVKYKSHAYLEGVGHSNRLP